MESLSIDFTTQRGHEMIVFRDPPFMRSEMDEVDLNMLQAERVQHLLPVDWIELDGSMSFRYGIAGRRLLSHKLIGGAFGMEAYMLLLIGLIESMEACGHYLLRESCCLIHERFLFVGDDWSDIRVAYLPLREPPAARPIREELLALAVRLVGKVAQVDGEGLQDVLRLLDAPASPWLQMRNGLLDALERLRTRRLEQQTDRGASADRLADWSGHGAAGGRTGDLPDHKRPGTVPPPDLLQDRHQPGAGDAGEQTMSEGGGGRPAALGRLSGLFARQPYGTDKRALPEETSQFNDREWPAPESRLRDNSRARWFASAGALLSAAAVWRFVYLPAPDTSRLLAAVGLTLLVLWGLTVAWRKLSDPAESGKLDSTPHTGDFAAAQPYDDGGGEAAGWSARLRTPPFLGRAGVDAGSGRDDAGMSGTGPGGTPLSAAAPGAAGYPLPAEQDGSGASAYAAASIEREAAFGTGSGARHARPAAHQASYHMDSGLSDSTALPDGRSPDGAARSDETVLLDDRGDGGGAGCYFVREYEGQSMRMPLTEGVSVIGRSAALAQIVDQAEGVSRTHLEVEFGGDTVRIRDLASRNGTMLEDEPMIPYKEYVLRSGGSLRIAGADGPKYTLYRN